MDKFLQFLVSVAIIMVVVSISYRVRFLHKLVYGAGSAHLNEAAKAAVAGPAVPVQGAR